MLSLDICVILADEPFAHLNDIILTQEGDA